MRTNKGTFAAGNPGRPTGATNIATRAVRTLLQQIIENHYSVEQVAAYMTALDDTDKLRLFVQLLPYVAARPKNLEDNETAENFKQLDLSVLSDEDLRTLAAIQNKLSLGTPTQNP